MTTRHMPLRRDRRYQIRREYCGYVRARHVVRFCGEWLGQASNRAAAEAVVAAHKTARNALLTGAGR